MTVQKQLLGRGTYGPDVVYGPEVSPLWQFFLAPPAQNSVLIYTDGSVVERATFENNVTSYSIFELIKLTLFNLKYPVK